MQCGNVFYSPATAHFAAVFTQPQAQAPPHAAQQADMATKHQPLQQLWTQPCPVPPVRATLTELEHAHTKQLSQFGNWPGPKQGRQTP